MINEKFLDSLSLVDIKELYINLWLLNMKKEAKEVFNYLKENYPAVIEEEL